MKKTKRPTEQELLHQWLEGDLDLTQQLYVEKDEPQPEAVEPYQPKRDRDTFLRSLRRSLRLYNVLAFLRAQLPVCADADDGGQPPPLRLGGCTHRQ